MCLQSFKSYSHKKECMYHPHLIYKLLESSGSIEITHSSLTPNLSHPPVFLTIIYWCRKLIWYLFNYLQLLNMQAQLFVRLSCHYSNFQSDGTKASKCVSIKVKRILPHVLPLTNKKFMSVFSLTTAHYLHHNLCLLSSQDLFSFVLYIYMYMCLPMWRHVHVNTHAHKSQGMVDFLWLSSRAMASHWVGCWELNSTLQKEQYILITTGPPP